MRQTGTRVHPGRSKKKAIIVQIMKLDKDAYRLQQNTNMIVQY